MNSLHWTTKVEIANIEILLIFHDVFYNENYYKI